MKGSKGREEIASVLQLHSSIHSFIPFQVIDPISGLVEKLALGLGKGDLGAVDADSVKEQLIGALGSLGFQKKNKKQKAGDEL